MDLSRWVRPGFVNGAIRHLQQEPPEGAVRTPRALLPEGPDFDRDLERAYGIRYLAPADARDTRLPAGSIDLVATTSTLEHVPLPDLRAILKETRRLCHDQSVVSHVVDYSDHFAHGDDRDQRLQLPPVPLGAVGALQHLLPPPEPAAAPRLPADLRGGGPAVIEAHAEHDADAREQLASVPLAEDFLHYRTEEILRVGRFVLRASAGRGRA